jgi:hypothetical protein
MIMNKIRYSGHDPGKATLPPMNCYNHPGSPAHGFCVVCKKALCKSCMADGTSFVCCRGTCQTKAKSMDEILRQAIRLPTYGFSLLSLGCILILSAVMLGRKNEPITSVLGVTGIAAFVSGALVFFRGRRHRNKS